MKVSRLALAFTTLSLGLAMAASGYHVTITSPTWINGNELKPGDYRLQVEGTQIMITGHDSNFQVSGQVKTNAAKYPYTSLRSADVNGKKQLEEVDVGGTKTSILFQNRTTGAGGE